ncbi:MAG: hypothetical protein ACRDHS_06150, partial [Actinomycetota bacterium]
PAPLPGPRITATDLAEGVLWPHPPEWVVRFLPEDSSHVVDVEIATEEGITFVTGIAVRSGVSTSPSGTAEDPWLEGAEYEPVVPRDVQRLPLTRFARAALAIVNDPFTEEGRQEVQRILVPRGRPTRRRGGEFYRELLATARRLEGRGIPPVPEIARRKKVSQNLVHQWLHRARKLEGRSSSGKVP